MAANSRRRPRIGRFVCFPSKVLGRYTIWHLVSFCPAPNSPFGLTSLPSPQGAPNCQPLATLRAHEGPVWQVAWAHPKWGTLLASCSYDRKVIIWQGQSPTAWQPVHTHAEHMGSVNSISWCPHEHGLELACASSDGKVSILTHRADDGWDVKWLDTKQVGVNAVSWESTTGDGDGARRFASAGCDNTIRVWKLNAASGEWEPEGEKLGEAAGSGHSDWVRDVAWAPALGGGTVATIASCSQDQRVIIWKETAPGAGWTPTPLEKFGGPVWRVSWSLTGNILAVSCGDNSVTLWKESVGGQGAFEKLSDVEAAAVQTQGAQ